jgi:hypothetical protein
MDHPPAALVGAGDGLTPPRPFGPSFGWRERCETRTVAAVKLRLFRDSIRFRVRRPDLEALCSAGCVEHVVRIGPEPADLFTYRLRVVALPDWSVARSGLGLTVDIPAEAVRRWTASAEVGLSHTAPWGVRVMVEKDFPCMEPRPGEGNEGTFPRPSGTLPACTAGA